MQAAPDPTDWTSVAAGLRSTVAKLVHVEESLAPNCTCIMCLDTFKARGGGLGGGVGWGVGVQPGRQSHMRVCQCVCTCTCGPA